MREHLLHDFDIGRANAFTHGKTFCFEAIYQHFDIVITHGSCADDVFDVVEIDPLGVAMARYELVENVRNERGHDASLRTPNASSHPGYERRCSRQGATLLVDEVLRRARRRVLAISKEKH